MFTKKSRIEQRRYRRRQLILMFIGTRCILLPGKNIVISSRANLVSEDSLESVEDDLHLDQHDNDHDLHLHPKDPVCSNKVN